MGRQTEQNTKAVGAELAAVLPDIKPWYKEPHLLRLNLYIIGCASGFFLSAPLLIAENAYPTHRGICVGSACGVVLANALAPPDRPSNSFRPWVCSSSAESPRWLVSMDRVEEARAVIANHHANGDTRSPLVKFEMMEIEETISRREGSALVDDCGVGVISYYLAMVLSSVGITSVDDQTLISACIQIWNLFCATGAAVMVDRVGRRALFLASGSIMLVSFSIVTGLSGSFATTGNAPTGTAVIPFLFIFYLGYDMALTPLMVSYPLECWPYRLRAKGLTAGPDDESGCKYYFVFLVVLVIMIVSVWFGYPETRGRTLENVAFLFDGDGAEVGPGTASGALKQAEGLGMGDAAHVEVSEKR
ncbi:Lactose permease [Colletotrichum trifolii]|uniref:Lactose permease n=1 Tax=Colletotrichum trifolii TaxID=5466 RepID=A0A4R8RM29_COLTR|nr:Lactose permease [Colletotrichum trifolii]